jgi:hypothetical protein
MGGPPDRPVASGLDTRPSGSFTTPSVSPDPSYKPGAGLAGQDGGQARAHTTPVVAVPGQTARRTVQAAKTPGPNRQEKT